MPRATLDPDKLKAALDARSREPVQVRETHISWVFLTDDRALKLKKPLVLPFLDYGTPKRRQRMCQREVRLNRRLAPHVYLGVKAVVQTNGDLELAAEDAAGALDYVVEMRRYDEHDTLAAALDRGELNRRQVAEVARMLAAFHDRCRSVRDLAHGAHGVEQLVARNIEELLDVVEAHSERRWIRSVARFLSAFVSSRSQTLDSRAEGGRIKECHGDLRAEHVILRPELSVVDCVEFDTGLRTLDVADDLAFLFMDMSALGGARFAGQLIAGYRQAGGDPGDEALLFFYAAHRALVRAKVLLVRAAQRPPRSSAHGHASAQARDLLSLAERFVWRARRPLAIAACGVPASGKSHLVKALASASGLPRLSSDVLRKRLAGIRPTEHASTEQYSDEFSHATYAELGLRAAAEVTAQGGVLLDATFRRRSDRDAFREAFAESAPLLFVECLAPLEVLTQRASSREQDPRRVSDATLAVVLRERDRWEPLDEVPSDQHVVMRTDREVDQIIDELLAVMDQRLATGKSPGATETLESAKRS